MIHDYKPNSITALFTAPDVRDGIVLGRYMS
jgi:hypothetical protein